jgi:hypothetical protein
VNSSIGLLNDRLRISGLLDFRGGFVSHNVNNLFQCAFIQNCRALHDPTASLLEQAKAVAGPRAFGAYGEKADFIRLRELSAAYTLPSSLAATIRASSAMLVLTGRNLWLQTDFTSWDPENVTGGQDASNYNYVQLAQPRQWLLRVNLSF